MLELNGIRALHAVSTTGSISSAATVLHLTTSAVSQRLAKLEREVGQTLLERHSRGVLLTDAAKLLVDRADKILALVDQTEAELEGHRGAVVGQVSIAGFPTAARGLLTGTLTRLSAEFPALFPKISELEPDVSVPLVIRGDLDIAVVQDWFNVPLSLPPGLSRTELLDDVADLALPASHPLAERETVDLIELHSDRWISWTPGSGCYEWLLYTLRGYGIEPQIVHTAGEYATQLALVQAGFGIAVIPRLGQEAIPEGVRVVRVQPLLSRHVYAVWRTGGDRRPAIRAAIAALSRTAQAAL
ncbi:LysR family transcriptional regulator [Kitasatospora aureofaciens]|uniref:LysR family transcriptional regulator n=1 Tax=Kitasatospora aureofaciens TaxID=1894 RepID=UPI0036F45795